MNDLQLFMRLYMYELELWLNNHKTDLLNISYQSDEANTDRPLKEFIKKAIELHCNSLTQLNGISSVVIDNVNYAISVGIRNAVINGVILPPISNNLKGILKSKKNAVFTEPDICLAININGKIEYETIELKSTKNDSIPGSSVQQITPEEWVIFVKHTNHNVEVTTGQYFYAINSKIQFPDRSPRPQVSFSELQNWNHQCRKINNNAVIYKTSGDETEKYGMLTDWQGVLARRWVNVLFNDHPGKKEPWFDNNLRKFILEFLKRYDQLTEEQKEQFKAFTAKNIK